MATGGRASVAKVTAMLSISRLPNWPPPDGEVIGEERAREYIAWIREHAPPLVAEGRRVLQQRFEISETCTSSVPPGQLAGWGLDEGMVGLSIGCVWAAIQGGTWATMNISIRRDGRLELKPGWNVG